jgi:hypothetical protein
MRVSPQHTLYVCSPIADATMKEDCVMKTMWQSQGKTIICLLFLLISLSLHPSTTSAQSPSDTSICEYQETRQNAPINPKTSKPYTPEERNQEPFAGPSITKEQIKQCLQAEQHVKNHHILFEDYRDAWQDLAKEMGKYDIPLLIYGGVLHAKTPYDQNTGIGAIRLLEFGDPMMKDASQLTEEERKTFGLTEKNDPIVLIRSLILWQGVFIDPIVSTKREEARIIFSNYARFLSTTFNKKADFSTTTFNKKADFSATTFNKKADFNESHFNNEAVFGRAIFNDEAEFFFTTFNNKTVFGFTTFNNEVSFDFTIFNNEVDFTYAIFNNKTSFSSVTFNNKTYFTNTIFNNEVDFFPTTFNNEAYFLATTFNSEAGFRYTTFKDKAYFRDMRVKEKLTFDNTMWEGRVDLRSISAKELHWDSAGYPSEVKGVFDLREATIGRATFSEVRFQDIVDFSRTTFGQYKVKNEDEKPKVMKHPLPQVLFENNTFEKDVDLLHVVFGGSALLINNRFRSTLDLTGATFEAHNADTSYAQDMPPRLCLSYNRIHRLALGLEHLGNPPSASPYELLIAKPLGSLFANPLQTSRVRRVVAPEGGPEGALTCDFADTTTSNTKNANANRYVEHLDDIYKTIGQSFREANNQGGVNEAWYLQKVVEQNQQSPRWRWLSRVFFDMPSRYAVDVWRTVWVSMMIILGFAGVYWWGLWRLGRDHHTLQGPEYAPRQRAFRIRLFEPIHRNSIRRTRRINPWWDALALSFRAFTKIGFGTAYPNTWSLKVLTSIEWVLGVYMLIHFILAVKNNLPFILPFLGVVN